jgi:FHA domain
MRPCSCRHATGLCQLICFEEKTMKEPWSPMLALGAAAAVLQVYGAATAAGADLIGGGGPADQPDLASSLLVAATDAGDQAWRHLRYWVSEGYHRAPALMLGLSVLLAVPPLALAGLFASRKHHRSPDATQLISRSSARRGGRRPIATVHPEISAWPTEAWVEVDREPGKRYVIGRTLVRIGREEDNDICLSLNTVHRYHAVIRRTTEGEVVITDLSGDEGNGVLVNGKQVAEARLAQGDTIHLGEVRLRFDARPA